MKFQMLSLVFLLTIMISPVCGAQQGFITFNFEDRSLFPGNLQIRDEICQPSEADICDSLSAINMSLECQQNPFLDKCVKARANAIGACSCKEAGPIVTHGPVNDAMHAVEVKLRGGWSDIVRSWENTL